MSTLKLTQVVGAPVSVGVWVSVRDCVEVVKAPPHDVTINTAVSITGNVIVSRFIAPLFYLERNSMVGFQFANRPEVERAVDLPMVYGTLAISPKGSGRSSRYIRVVSNRAWPNHLETVLTGMPLANQWRAALCLRVWVPTLFSDGMAPSSTARPRGC